MSAHAWRLPKMEIRAVVDSNNGNDTGNKGNNADGNKGKENDTVGKLSDGLLRLVEEDDGKGNVCYCVEAVSDNELVYSSVSKAQAFSFCEGIELQTAKELLSHASLKRMATTTTLTISLVVRLPQSIRLRLSASVWSSKA
jgi:hypothetical protein